MENRKAIKEKIQSILFSPIKNFASFLISIFVSAVFIFVMGIVIYFSSTVFQNNLKSAAVIFSSIICSVLTVPLTLIWTPKIRELIKKTDDKNQIIIGNQQNQITQLKLQVENQKSAEENLQSKIQMLENLVFSSKNSVDIFKVGYKEYTKISTIRIKEKLSENPRHLFSSGGYDEAVVIIDCKIKYQRGIDLKNLKMNFQGTNKDAVIVTNLKPEYTSTPVFEYETFFSEMRHVETDKNGNIKKIQISKDLQSNDLLAKIENQYKRNFEVSFQSDENTEAVEETAEVLKIAKDCIRLLLKPYFSKIEFDSICEVKDAKQWTDFLQQQVENYKNLEVK